MDQFSVAPCSLYNLSALGQLVFSTRRDYRAELRARLSESQKGKCGHRNPNPSRSPGGPHVPVSSASFSWHEHLFLSARV